MNTTITITDTYGFKTKLPLYATKRDAIIDMEHQLATIPGNHSLYTLSNTGSCRFIIPVGYEFVGRGCHSTQVNERGNSVCRTHDLYAIAATQ